MGHHTHFTGKAGEFAVASQLLLRGIEVYFPAVDSGIDLIAGGKIRIQVKAARKMKSQRDGSYGYHFNLSSSAWDSKSKRMYGKRRDWSKLVDFFALWGVDENRFWIVPSHVMRSTNVRIIDDSLRHSVNSEDVKALLGTGLNQREVSKRLGISEMSVSRVVNGKAPKTLPGVCYEVSKCEGAWHEVIAAVGLTGSIDEIQSEVEEVLTTHA